jgi:hypothetical protein
VALEEQLAPARTGVELGLALALALAVELALALVAGVVVELAPPPLLQAASRVTAATAAMAASVISERFLDNISGSPFRRSPPR